MSDNIIRHDIIKLDVDTDTKILQEMLSELNAIKKAINGAGEADGLDKVKKQADNANEASKKLKDSLTKVGDALGTVAKKAAKISLKALTVGITATATAMGALAKQSVEAYAELEQLKGGVETLFGAKGAKSVEEYAKYVNKDVSKVTDEYNKLKEVEQTVYKNANNAWKTSGLSANDYMTTVTTFSASLIQSLGGDTKKAASMADVALQDMADNANKMGTDIGMIQNAYSGFARGQYMLLDNLKLGYAGTKTEMERLLKDAGKIAGKEFKIESYADIIEAIHTIQENMGITGTTAKEAEKTITGSLNALKATWGNLLPAFITGGDELDQCINNFVEAFGTFGKNALPAVEKALGGIGVMIEKLVPIIEKEFPVVVEKLLPPLLKAASALLSGLIKSLPSIVKVVVKEIPNILNMISNAIAEAVGGKSFIEPIKKAVAVVGGLLLGGLVAFKGINAIKGITSIFGSAGGAGGVTGVFNPLTALATVSPVTILKGLGNLAIILGGLGALAAVFVWLAPKIAALGDLKSVLKVALVMGVLGTLGTALAYFAGIVGLIPIPVVLQGLANMALVLGGITAIIVAWGALSKIDGFNALVESGGQMLVKLCNILGEMAGSIIGGLGEGITNSLPAIGDNLSAFAKSLKPMFDTFNGVDMTGIGNFLTAFGKFTVLLAGEKVASFFTGKTNYAQLGTDLTTFVTNAKGFFDVVATIPEESFPKAVKLFDTLAGLKSLPKEGGVVGWFSGEVNYANIASGLGSLAGEGTPKFFKMVSAIDPAAFDKTKLLFETLSGIKALPKDGGFWQSLGDSITGKETRSPLSAIAEDLGIFAEKTATFFAQVNALNLVKLNGLWESLKGTDEITTQLSTIVDENISSIVKKVSDLPNQMAAGIRKSGASLSSAFVTIWTNAVKASVAPINKLIKGANLALKASGKTNYIPAWQPYANGTNGHKGGNALVNDGRGAELVQMPNGNTFIPKGRNVLLPNAPKGMKVFSAEHTASLMGKPSPTFSYANGTTPTINAVGERYIPDGYTGSKSSVTENNSYAPVFNLTISGTSDDRATARKVKQWVQEAMEEVFESLARRNVSEY